MILFFLGMIVGSICGIVGSIGVALWVRDEIARLPFRQKGAYQEELS